MRREKNCCLQIKVILQFPSLHQMIIDRAGQKVKLEIHLIQLNYKIRIYSMISSKNFTQIMKNQGETTVSLIQSSFKVVLKRYLNLQTNVNLYWNHHKLQIFIVEIYKELCQNNMTQQIFKLVKIYRWLNNNNNQMLIEIIK